MAMLKCKRNMIEAGGPDGGGGGGGGVDGRG